MEMKPKCCIVPGHVIDRVQWKDHYTTHGLWRDLLLKCMGIILGPVSVPGSAIAYEEPEQVDKECLFTYCV